MVWISGMDQWCGFVVWFINLMKNSDMVASFPLLVKVSIKERNKGIQPVNMGRRLQAVSRARTAKSKKNSSLQMQFKIV